MDIWTLLLMSIGLAMDAFAVSVSSGIVLCHTCWRQTVRISGSFGLFQGLMPLVGYTIARTFADKIGAVDHWVAFGLLAFIGGKMLWEAFTEDEDEGDGKDAEKIDLGEYLILAIATSIDALAVGISFAALSVDIVPAVSLIGITTFIFSVAGVAIGHTFGARYEKPATIVGGVVLILIGLKILLEHLGILAL